MREQALMLVVAFCIGSELGCGRSGQPGASVPPPPTAIDWSQEKSDRQSTYENYLAEKKVSHEWFAHASNSLAGPPFLLVRLLPDLEPEIWGTPEEEFSRFGLFHTAADAGRPLPTGLGWDTLIEGSVPPLHMVSLTCGACHIGRVRLPETDESGQPRMLDLVGGPNTQVDVRKWRHAFEQTAAKRLATPEGIQSTAAELVKLMDEKPSGYFYGGWGGVDETREAAEREMFRKSAAQALAGLAQGVQGGRLAVEKELKTSYSKSNHPPLDGGTPGQSDGSGDLIPKLILGEALAGKSPEETPAAIQDFLTRDDDAITVECATATDNLSTWRQSEHALAQLDGSVKSPFFRNIAAILAIAGRPSLVNVQNADISAELIHDLPPPPYPFDVDGARAARGKTLFQEHCEVCHRPNSVEVYQTLLTDDNRARVLRPATFELFLRNFLNSVPEDYTYTTTGPDGSAETVRPRALQADEVLIDRSDPAKQGYLAGALEGLWARAPYLHNGSVPTLRHLLAPNDAANPRPAKFVRGCVSYDTANVGFVWQLEKLAEFQLLDPVAAVYDTQWDGCSNSGHDKNLVVDGKERKLDWSGESNQEDLLDLIEYLKTL